MCDLKISCVSVSLFTVCVVTKAPDVYDFRNSVEQISEMKIRT